MFNKKNKFFKLFSLGVFLFLALSFLFNFSKPVLANDIFGADVVANDIALGDKDPRTMAARIINIAMSFLGVIAVAIVIYAGFMWMSSGGEEEKVNKAKRILKAGIIGLLIILASWGITIFVLNRLGGATGTIGGPCVDGEHRNCGCDGKSFCTDGSWGPCIGSDCSPGDLNSWCSSNPNACDPDDTQCKNGLICGLNSCRCEYKPCGTVSDGVCTIDDEVDCGENSFCDQTSCRCLPDESNYSELGEPCNAGDTCTGTENTCNPHHGLSCDTTTCKCVGEPLILAISPVGGFCVNDINRFCEEDSHCPGSTCDKTTANAAKGNLISIFGQNFNTYGESSVVNLIKGEIVIPLQNPQELNNNCDNTWTNSKIIMAVPQNNSLLVGDDFELEVITQDGKSDRSKDDFGPKIEGLKINNISRPGVCNISPTEAEANEAIYYYGVGLKNSEVYFGNLFNNVLAFAPNKITNDTSGAATVPSLRAGDTSTFVKKNGINSNSLSFLKKADAPAGPFISSFSPSAGSAGQYVSILGANFGRYRGNSSVYFKLNSDKTEANFSFPAVCADNLWSDSQILVKVPSGIVDGNYDLVVKIDSWNEVDSNNFGKFNVSSTIPLMPSVCKISPSFGPHNTNVSLWGEYFGESASAVFYKEKETAPATASVENGASKISVNVPANSLSGPVKVKRNGQTGNSLNFSVGTCTKNENCSGATPHCCLIGTPNAGACVENESACFADVPQSSFFQWRFVTGLNEFTFDPPSNAESCSDFLFCPLDKRYQCPNSPGICATSTEGACECCCDKSKNATTSDQVPQNPDCCHPLICASTCGPSAASSTLGLCSGCEAAGNDTETRDLACNCLTSSGKYCDTSYPNGACLDCSELKETACKTHSAVCCWDKSESKCRAGVSGADIWGEGSSDIGFCPYYDCDSQNPTICSSIPKTSGAYKNNYLCQIGCGANCGAITNEAACKANRSCCWSNSPKTIEIKTETGTTTKSVNCLGGAKYDVSASSTDDNYGLCAFYNCETAGNVCLKSTITNETLYNKIFTNFSACNTKCQAMPAGAGTACYDGNVCSNIFCNIFSCLNEDGNTPINITTDPETCGSCCCKPTNISTEDICKQVGENLTCLADKGACTGANRGLCCGCFSDNDCVIEGQSPSNIGCGFDSCCYARPSITSVLPEPAKNSICRNAIIEINFDQRMDALSLDGNILLIQEKESGAACPSGTQKIAGLNRSDWEPVYQSSFLAKIKRALNKVVVPLAKIFVKKSIAAGDPVYCSVMGSAEINHGVNKSTVYFKPKQLLEASAKYFVVVKGDENLNSGSGVRAFTGIAMNGGNVYNNGVVNPSTFFNSYKNSYSWSFETLSSNTSGQGICVIDNLEINPSSYLFQDNKNDLNENDSDARHASFDSAPDKDKAFSVKAKTSDGQIIGPRDNYSWTYNWSISNTNVIEFNDSVVAWAQNSSNRLVQVKPNITDGKSSLQATVKMDENNIINDGEGKSAEVNIYVLLCKNPWPAVKSDGTWTPWVDSPSFNTSVYNYEFYYCRDAGRDGDLSDDLPAFMSDSAVIKGNSLFKVCSNDPTISCSNNSDCPGNALCIVSFLKETYLFRTSRARFISSFEALPNSDGSSVRLSWVSDTNNIANFRVYYAIASSPNNILSNLIPISNCSTINSRYHCSYTLSGLSSDYSYNVRVAALDGNSMELGSSFYTSVTPAFIPFVEPFTASDALRGNELDLYWESAVSSGGSNVKSFKVLYQREGSSNNYLTVQAESGDCSKISNNTKYKCNYRLRNLEEDRRYNLKVTALSSAGTELGFSRFVSAMPTNTPIPIVTNLVATNLGTGGKVKLTWKASNERDFTKFTIYQTPKNGETTKIYRTKEGANCNLSNNVYSCSLDLDNLTDNLEHDFYIETLNEARIIHTSAVVSVTPTSPYVAMVRGFQAVNTETGGNLRLSWKINKDRNFSDFKLFYRAQGGNLASMPLEKSICELEENEYLCTYNLQGLENNVNYSVYFEVYHDGRRMEVSPSVSATPTYVSMLSNFSAVDVGTGGKVKLTWEMAANREFTRFLLHRDPVGVSGATTVSLEPGVCGPVVNNKRQCSHTTNGLTNNQKYNFYLDVFVGAEKKETSPSVSATPTIPYVPMLRDYKVIDTAEGGTLKVSWKINVDRYPEFTKFELSRQPQGGSFTTSNLLKNNVCNLSEDESEYLCTYLLQDLINDRLYNIDLSIYNNNIQLEGPIRISATPTAPPLITNFKVTDLGIGGAVKVSFDVSSEQEFTSFSIKYSNNHGYNGTLSTNKNSWCPLVSDKYSCSYEIFNYLKDGFDYTFNVSIYNENTLLETSPTISSAVTFEPLINVSYVDPGAGGQVYLSWDSPQAGITSYYIKKDLVASNLDFDKISLGLNAYDLSFCDTENFVGKNVCEALIYSLANNKDYFIRIQARNGNKILGYSNIIKVRASGGTSDCSDVEYQGYTYSTVKIGEQCWFAENLRYNNGCSGRQEVSGEDTGWCVTAYGYNNGYLYQWSAAMAGENEERSQGLCPPGWHVPSKSDFQQLFDYLNSNSEYQCDGQYNYLAKALASNTSWNTSSVYCSIGKNLQNNNSSGFNALSVGYAPTKNSRGIGLSYLWTSTEDLNEDGKNAYYLYLNNNTNQINGLGQTEKRFGYGVRCLKD